MSRIYPGRPPLAIGDELIHETLGRVRVLRIRPAHIVDVEQLSTGRCYRISGSTI